MIKNELGRLEMHPLPPVKKAKVVLVGEYPNYTELRLGMYFVSTGAHVLRDTLNKVGIKQEDCYYTVAVPYLMNKKTKTIPKERAEQERQRLVREIQQSGADIVIPLGAFTSGMLLNSKGVTMNKVIGNIISIPELPGVRIIPNYHPAMLMHQPGAYKTFSKVMRSASILYKGGTLDPGKIEWSWVQTKQDLQRLIELCSQVPYGGVDIETSSLDTKQAMVWVIGIAVSPNEVYVIDRETYLKYPEQISELFRTTMQWVWHNGKYDTEVLYWDGHREARLDQDTIYLHYCLNETGGTHGLGILSSVYLGADEYKSKLNSEFSNITTEDAYGKYKQDLGERVATDAAYTFQLYEILYPKVMENPDWKKLYQTLLIPGGNFLRGVQIRGAKIDRAYLEHRSPSYEHRIDSLVKEIQDSVDSLWDPELYKSQTGRKTASDKFKPTSVPQMQWMIYDRMGLRPKLRSKRGTGAEILESIENPPEFIQLVLQLRKVKKEYSTYVKSYLKVADENDIVHCTFNLHTTQTGRLSCTDPNLQNVPSGRPDVRRAFIPRGPGRILMEVDYSGAELRVLAHVSGDENLARALTEGDPHGELAEMLFGTRYTEGSDAVRKDLRGRAKTVNFGVAYGREKDSISTSFGISLEEAQSYIDGWASLYPKAWEYLQGCAKDVLAGKPLTTFYGRWRRFGLITKSNKHDLINEAKNFRIQSISSDNLLYAAMQADKTLESVYDAYIINLIHDSVLIDCPGDPETVQAVSKYMSQTMAEVPKKLYGCKVPFAVDTDLGKTWGDVHEYDNEREVVIIDQQEYKYEQWAQHEGIL